METALPDGFYYHVVDWNVHFENNRSRELKNLRWIPMPNKQDGEGYGMVVYCQPESAGYPQEGAANFGLWCALVEVASKCSPRGSLLRSDGTPMTPQSLALKTRLPQVLWEQVHPFFVDDVKWLERVPMSQEGAGFATEGNGIEGNRIEQKGREKSVNAFIARTLKTIKPEHAQNVHVLLTKLYGDEWVDMPSAAKDIPWAIGIAKDLKAGVLSYEEVWGELGDILARHEKDSVKNPIKVFAAHIAKVRKKGGKP